MQTDKWGSSAWEHLHATAFGAPEILDKDDKLAYTAFYTNLRCTLPCGLCRHSYGYMLNHIQLHNYIDTRDGLCFWTYIIHNIVNAKLGKPTAKLEDVIFKYENMRARCGKKGTPEYIECIKSLPEIPFSMDEAQKKANEMHKKFDVITKGNCVNYYNFIKNNAHNHNKCS